MDADGAGSGGVGRWCSGCSPQGVQGLACVVKALPVNTVLCRSPAPAHVGDLQEDDAGREQTSRG